MVEHIALGNVLLYLFILFYREAYENVEHNALENVLLIQLYYFMVRLIIFMSLSLEKFNS